MERPFLTFFHHVEGGNEVCYFLTIFSFYGTLSIFECFLSRYSMLKYKFFLCTFF